MHPANSLGIRNENVGEAIGKLAEFSGAQSTSVKQTIQYNSLKTQTN